MKGLKEMFMKLHFIKLHLTAFMCFSFSFKSHGVTVGLYMYTEHAFVALGPIHREMSECTASTLHFLFVLIQQT